MKKKATIDTIQREVVLKMLPHIAFDGWTMDVLHRASDETDYSKDLIQAAFSNGIRDAVTCFARYIDEGMLERLNTLDTADMRVREKIKIGVQTRLEVLEEYKEAERLAVGFWTLPSQARHGLKSIWQTADVIWEWAGDTATDYNRYTKRGLLSGVLAKTTLYWLNDESTNYQETDAFLDRQISRVLSMGKMMGGMKNTLDRVWKMMPFASSRA